MAETKVVGVLDTNGRLVGSKIVAADEPNTVLDPGDLPLNGSYKLSPDGTHFIPLGHGFGKIGTRQPHSMELVVRKLIESLGPNAPFECVEWAAWYDQELRRRDEEFSARPK